MVDLISIISKFDPNVQSAIISATTTISIFSLGAVGKLLYDNFSLSYKLRKEYGFEQMKSIKNEIKTNKSKLMLAGEDLNYRFWNMKENIDEQWHNIPKKYWPDSKNYYLHSFAYRWLVFFALVRETEKGIVSFDNDFATRRDRLYLKYIKTMRNIFSDLLLLKEFNYTGEPATNHFFKDNIDGYISYIKDDSGNIIDYKAYCHKIEEDIMPVYDIYSYITKIENVPNCINLNVIKEFHILLMRFLNMFGQDYQKTSLLKYARYVSDEYMKIYNKASFMKFIKRSKLRKHFLVEKMIMKKHRTTAST